MKRSLPTTSLTINTSGLTASELRSSSVKLLSLNVVLTLAVCLLLSLLSKTALAEQVYQHESTIEEVSETAFDVQFSEAELAQMLAPIALYPDSLLTHILIASTYPLEVVEAKRWLDKHSELTTEKIAKKVEKKGWDASVKALIPFPRILTRLNDDLTWTRQLGDAFLQDESRLLSAIQLLREQADKAGNLDKMENMAISRENNAIVIEPLQREVVYVPYYDASLVYGNWAWRGYPPVFWSRPLWPHRNYVRVSHYSPFYWHSGIHISFNYFFSAFNWHDRHVIVVNPRSGRHYQGRKHIVRSGYAKRWHHQPEHRRGVAYRSNATKARYHSNRESVSQNHYAKGRNVVTRAPSGNVRVVKTRHTTVTEKLARGSHKENRNMHNERMVKNKARLVPSNKMRTKNVRTQNVQTKNVQARDIQTRSVQPKNNSNRNMNNKSYNNQRSKVVTKTVTKTVRKEKTLHQNKAKSRTTSHKQSPRKSANNRSKERRN